MTVAVAGFAVASDELAVGSELLDAVVAPVGDEYVAVRGDADAPGHVHFAVAVAVFAPAEDVRAVGRELLHAVVVLICDVQVIVCVDSDAGWSVEVARLAAERPPMT